MTQIAILACNGATRLGSTFTRQAAYRIKELRPDSTLLVSSTALMARVPEHEETIRQHPTIVIEGCLLDCAEQLLKEMQLAPAASIKLFEVMAQEKIPISGEHREQLSEKGMQLVEAMAQQAAAHVDELVAAGAAGPIPLAEDATSTKEPAKPAARTSRPAGPKKTYLFPCVGLTRPEGTVTRDTAYAILADLRPKTTRLGCAPPVFSDATPEADFSNYHLLALEGCSRCCVTKIAREHGRDVAATLVVEHLLQDAGVDVTGQSAVCLGEEAKLAVAVVTERSVAEIDRLLACSDEEER